MNRHETIDSYVVNDLNQKTTPHIWISSHTGHMWGDMFWKVGQSQKSSVGGEESGKTWEWCTFCCGSLFPEV